MRLLQPAACPTIRSVAQRPQVVGDNYLGRQDSFRRAAKIVDAGQLPLQQIKTKVAGLSSIPQILHLQNQADDRFDEAMDAVAATIPKPPIKVAAPPAPTLGTAAGGVPAVTVPLSTGHNTGTGPKPSQVVRAADFSPKSYLESEAEVDAYLTSLKTKLLAVLHAGQRIRIQ